MVGMEYQVGNGIHMVEEDKLNWVDMAVDKEMLEVGKEMMMDKHLNLGMEMVDKHLN